MKRPIKTTKIDAIFSLVIRTRDRWTCQRCGAYFPEGRRQGIHASHFVGRSAKATRFHLDNCCAHCHGCHAFLGSRPLDFHAFIVERLGEERAMFMRLLGHSTCKFTKADLQDIYAHFKDTHERQLRRRQDGLWLTDIEDAPPVAAHEATIEKQARMQ